jgi:hypothetical protein
MKLAKNSQLKPNLQRQAETYKAASDAGRAIKVILFFSAEEEERVAEILTELGLTNDKDIVLLLRETEFPLVRRASESRDP